METYPMKTGKHTFLVIASAFLLAFFCFVFLAMEKTKLSRANIRYTGKDIELGAHLYGLHCRNCHGIQGEGIGQLGPPLHDKLFFTARTKEVGWTGTLDDYIKATTSHGRMMGTRPLYAGNGSTMVMPPWSNKEGGVLMDHEINAVTKFVLNWEATALGEVEFEKLLIPRVSIKTEETVARGKEIFGASCNTCHGFDGFDNPQEQGPDLADIKTVAPTRRDGMEAEDYIEESLLIPDMYLVEGFGSTSTCGPPLSISELQAVTAFLLK